ncbi:MAG: Pyruvate, phosphate dikinase [Blastococcus sp.]|jgi:pyruvate,orthophosphate dikinase|nr:Pyruvate, phosphate dikinase [Blastococcus sp.]
MTAGGEAREHVFTLGFDEADPDDVDRLGGKGAGLARMTRSGLRVPAGYIISTDACRRYLEDGRLPARLADEVQERLAELETRTGKAFGAGPLPLLLSVRSGAPISMPGMMDTILNLGLNRDAAVALAEATGDSRFVADLVARFHAMYSETVLGALDTREQVSTLVDAVAPGDDPGSTYDRIWAACEASLAEDTGDSVPAHPHEQLMGAVEAVLRSWNTRRARTYREHHGIPHDLGTAVVVQAMVFGNLSADSGSGVVFTRNPVTGEPGLFGEYLAHSQGEDVVAGTRTPDPVTEALAAPVLEELRASCAELERAHGDVLDIEFTVERSVLHFLQVRSAKRTPEAAVRIAADLLAEGVLDPASMLRAISPAQVRLIQRPGFDQDELAEARAGDRLLTTGIGACPGQVSGELVLDPDRARDAAQDGRAVILARPITSPSDLHGMIAARGIVTATGGSTSHAAVVARALGTPCIVGASQLSVDLVERTLTVAGRTVREGDPVAVDGATGELFRGTFTSSTPATATAALSSLLRVAHEAASCEVFGRVTIPADVDAARSAGATGLVTAIDDVLAASGDLDELVKTLLDHGGAASVGHLAEIITEQLTPVLAEAGECEVGVRAIDFLADEARELLQQTALTTRHPQLSVPLGVPALIEAQLDGLAGAVRASGGRARVHLAVRHMSDPAEAVELRRLRSLREGRPPLGAYATSPRAVANIGGIAEAADVLWLEVRALQAAVFGIPARQLLTAEPLDSYVQAGLLSVDPRHAIDPSVDELLARVAAQAATPGAKPTGLRLSGEVAGDIAARLYAHGFRRFAVEATEVRPLLVSLGRAALAG